MLSQRPSRNAFPLTCGAIKPDAVCMRPGGALVAKKNCGEGTHLTRNNVAETLGLQPAGQCEACPACPSCPACTCSACSACGTDLSGNWRYVFVSKDNVLGTPRNVTLTQSGNAVTGSSLEEIVGRVEGNWVHMTFTQEIAEGWVALAEGSITQYNGTTYMQLVIIGDTFGADNASHRAVIFTKQ